MHLEKIPITSLALLPLKTRWNLLWNLPLADVCLLETTQFTNGMIMDDYWKTVVSTDVAELGSHSECMDCILDKASWSPKKLCSPCRWETMVDATTIKEWVYSVLAAEAITKIGIMEELPPRRGCTALYSTVVPMQPIRNHQRHDLYTFLFAVRRFYQGDKDRWCTGGVVCEFEFPSRHCKYEVPLLSLEESRIYQSPRYYPMNASERKSLLDAVVCCFDGRKPRVVSTCRGLLDDISEEVSDFLSEVKFFSCLICDPSTELPSLEMALKGPTNLEALIIHNGCDRFAWPRISLDSVFAHITNLPFLASLSILAVGDGDHSYFEFSRNVFDNLRLALKSISCTHHRRIQVDIGTIILEKDTEDLSDFTTYTFCENCPELPAFPY
jgi:hypothetical protein